jgi:cytochrome c oxidase assembly protein subunit 15
VAATVTTFLLVGVGGLVRATGSGLGCPGWPRCFGRWIPPFEVHAIIEYTHRVMASIDLILIGMLAAVAWRSYRGVPRVVRPALVALGVVVVQAGLGAIVVEGELAPLLVTAHFAMAMVLVAVVVYAAVASYTVEEEPSSRADGLVNLARVAAGSTLVLMVVGAYVRGEGAGLAFAGWPLMDGRLVPSLDSSPAVLHFAHRALALVVGLLTVALTVRAWRDRSRRMPVAALAVVATALFLAQVMVGAANVWTGLAPAAVVPHVSLASLAWGAVVATAAVARVLPDLSSEER